MAYFEDTPTCCVFLNDKSVFSVSLCLFVLQWSWLHVKMLQTSFEDCVFSTQNARSAVDCPHIYSQWLAPGKALVPAQQWPSPKHKQFGGFQDETSLMHSTHFFLSIVTAVFGKNLSYSLTLNSVSSPPLYSYATMWRWITEIACKHVIFWISASQTVARWVKVKTLLDHWKLWFWNKATGLFLINLLQVCWLNVYDNSPLIEIFQHWNNFIFHLRPGIL